MINKNPLKIIRYALIQRIIYLIPIKIIFYIVLTNCLMFLNNNVLLSIFNMLKLNFIYIEIDIFSFKSIFIFFNFIILNYVRYLIANYQLNEISLLSFFIKLLTNTKVYNRVFLFCLLCVVINTLNYYQLCSCLMNLNLNNNNLNTNLNYFDNQYNSYTFEILFYSIISSLYFCYNSDNTYLEIKHVRILYIIISYLIRLINT